MLKLRLQIELVPPQLWGFNLRTYLTQQRWIRLRNAVRFSANFTCEICGHKAREESGVGVHAHEDWHYQDDANPASATLDRIGCICMLCHQTHHIKQTRNMVASGEAPQQLLDDVIAHFCKVNECDLTMFEHETSCLRSHGGEDNY